MSISEIARVLGVSRYTVRSALASEGPPRYVRRPMASVVDCQAFRGTLAAKVIVCRPADPEVKGLVERFHD